MGDDLEENMGEPVGQHASAITQIDHTKELKIDGYNYEISEPEIRKWIEMYVGIKSEIKEVKREAQSEQAHT